MRQTLQIFLLLSTLVFLFSIKLGAADLNQVKGLWVVRHTLNSAQGIDTLLEVSKKCGITDLFVQVRGRGDAYYNSHFEPQAKNLEKNYDPLGYLLKNKLSKLFRIHLWLNVFYVWSADSLPTAPNHVLNKEKNWLAQSKKAGDLLADYPKSVKNERIEGLFISPLHPQAQEYFYKIVADLTRQYHVDGIHFDYIRFPNSNFDLNPAVTKKFRQENVIDPARFLLHPDTFVEKYSYAGYEAFSNMWKNYLRDGLSDFIHQISGRLREKNPNLILTAAVKPDLTTARWKFFQDWERWVKKHWLDYVVPMNYAADTSVFSTRLKNYDRSISDHRYLVGIALFNQPEKEVISKIRQVEALDNAGYVLFSYTQLKKSPLILKYLKE